MNTRSSRAPLFGLLALCAITLFFGLGRIAFLGPDEPRYAEIAREMWVNHDYVSPKLAGRLWLEKAPLLYWGQALFYSLLGPHELPARLPSAFGALFTVLGLVWAARRAFGPRSAWYVGIVAATLLPMMVWAHSGTTDMPLCATLGGALLCFWLSKVDEKRRQVYFLASAALVAGSMLAKGLIGPLLFVLILGIWSAWARPTSKQKPVMWLAGLAVFGAVVATWYWPVWAKHGSFFFQEFVVNQHFKRYTSNEYNHPQPFYFYLALAPLATLPWLPWLIAAAKELPTIKPRFNDRNSLLALGWVWALVPIAFFSISGSKLPSYILPSFPGFAILIGEALSRGVFLPRTWKPKWFALGGSVLMSGVVLFLFLVYGPKKEPKLSTKALCLRILPQMKPGEMATLLRLPKDYDPVFYLQGRFIVGQGKRDIFYADKPEQFVPILKKGSLLVFVNNLETSSLENNPAFTAQFLDSDQKLSVYRLTLRK